MKIALGIPVVHRDGRRRMRADGRLPLDASGAEKFFSRLFSQSAPVCLICAASKRLSLQHVRSTASILLTADVFIATCITSICRR